MAIQVLQVTKSMEHLFIPGELIFSILLVFFHHIKRISKKKRNAMILFYVNCTVIITFFFVFKLIYIVINTSEYSLTIAIFYSLTKSTLPFYQHKINMHHEYRSRY